MSLTFVPISALSLERYATVLDAEQAAELVETTTRAREVLAGRAVWSVNSTAVGGGVAEMLRSLISYARGVGVDARWTVIGGDPGFFEVTKRLHNNLHGAPGDGGELGHRERIVYERIAKRNAEELAEVVRPGDIVLLHDPQTAALCAPLRAHGARVVWRCHVGLDAPNAVSRNAWDFLRPYLETAEAIVFSRQAYAWEGLDGRVLVVPPSLDAFSAKNQELDPDTVTAILAASGLGDAQAEVPPVFTRQDGAPARVDRRAEVLGGVPPFAKPPVVTQVSRWDRLKDPLGVMSGFVEHVAPHTDARLLLAGPAAAAVSDDPEGAAALAEVQEMRGRLPPELRDRIYLANLPMEDADENGAIVNAIQRRSHVVVQKSLVEGFGLTVLEGMWKARPVVASRVGGIQDQIVDGESGLLVDAGSPEEFGAAVRGVLSDPSLAARLGRQARERVVESFLGPRHLTQYVDLFARLLGA